MANVQVLYGESVAATTANSTTWVDLASIAAASFTANHTYLILANQVSQNNSSASEGRFRLVYGATPTVFTDGSYASEEVGTSSFHENSWAYIFTQGSSTELVKLQISSSSTNVTTNILSQILAIDLTDFTSGTHYHTNEVTADYTITATPTAKAITASFTPNGTDTWLFIGNQVVDYVTIVDEVGFELYDSVAGVLGMAQREGEDATNDVLGTNLYWVGVPTNAARTVAVRPFEEAGSNISLSSRVFALNLTAMFEQVASTFAAAEVNPAFGSWTNMATLSPTPNTTGDWVVLGFSTQDVNTGSEDMNARLQINASGGGLVDAPAKGTGAPYIDIQDPLDEEPYAEFKLISLSSGAARTLNWDWTRPVDAGSTGRIEDNGMVAFSVVKATAGMSGSGGVAFGYSEAATGEEGFTGTVATAYTWSEAGEGAAGAVGDGASTYLFSEAGTGEQVQPVTGDVATTYVWSEAAVGAEEFTGTAATAYGWSEAGVGAEEFTGTAATAYGWSEAGAGAEEMTGTGATAYTWSEAAAGEHVAPPVSGDVATTYTWSEAAEGTNTPPAVTGDAATAYTWSEEASGAAGASGDAATTYAWAVEGAGEQAGMPVSGDVATAYTWELAGTGEEVGQAVTGDGAPAWGFEQAADGYESMDGDVATEYPWAMASDGAVGAVGDAAQEYGWAVTSPADEIPGVVEMSGSAAVEFGWAVAADSYSRDDGPVFGWAVAGVGAEMLEPLSGGVEFGWSYGPYDEGWVQENIDLSGGTVFPWAQAAEGTTWEEVTGAGDGGSYGYTSDAVGEEAFLAVGDTVYPLTIAAAGSVDLTGTAAMEFPFSIDADGDFDPADVRGKVRTRYPLAVAATGLVWTAADEARFVAQLGDLAGAFWGDGRYLRGPRKPIKMRGAHR